MSILIKGIDLPKEMKEAESVDMIIYYNENRFVKEINPSRFVEIPTPHGRLIDGDKLLGEFIDWQYTEAPDHLNTKEGKMVTDHERQYELYLALGEAVIEIANAPTILESEE